MKSRIYTTHTDILPDQGVATTKQTAFSAHPLEDLSIQVMKFNIESDSRGAEDEDDNVGDPDNVPYNVDSQQFDRIASISVMIVLSVILLGLVSVLLLYLCRVRVPGFSNVFLSHGYYHEDPDDDNPPESGMATLEGVASGPSSTRGVDNESPRFLQLKRHPLSASHYHYGRPPKRSGEQHPECSRKHSI